MNTPKPLPEGVETLRNFHEAPMTAAKTETAAAPGGSICSAWVGALAKELRADGEKALRKAFDAQKKGEDRTVLVHEANALCAVAETIERMLKSAPTDGFSDSREKPL